MSTFTIVTIVAIIALIVGNLDLVIDWYRAYGRSKLYTKNNSPVMVDQQREERVKMLRSQHVHNAVSPHVRPMAAGVAKDRRSLLRAVSLGDRRVH